VASLTAADFDRALSSAAPPRARALAPPPDVGVLDLEAKSTDELEAAAGGGDVHYVQLGAGRCTGRHVGVRTARARVVLESWSLGLLKMDRSPHGFVTFLVPVGGRGTARIRGKPVEAGEVAVVLDGEAFDYRSTEGAQLVSASLERGSLEDQVRALHGRTFGEVRLQARSTGLWTPPAPLRAVCLELMRRTAARPALLRSPVFTRALEATLVKALLGGLETPKEPAAPRRGRVLALKAEAWLRQNLADPPTVTALCQALGASERTLHQVFREHLDTTPKAYLKTLRLNAARHGLLEGRQGRRVTDVALDWGFVHFGWFSQDYRRLFGETPSQTLQRGRAGLVRERRTATVTYPPVTTVGPRSDRPLPQPW
jgi:AraC family ethanolamine operon transcriptional activator